MQTHEGTRSAGRWATIHPLTDHDRRARIAMRAEVGPLKGKLQGAAARGPYDGIMSRVPAADGVTYQADTIGGVAGWWCTPPDAPADAAVVHLHGGWYNFGSAQAFRHFVGQIAARAGVAVFVPDYRLAPEHPFPAALDDAQACYEGLRDRDMRRIALTGDSAGGGLALALLAVTTARATAGRPAPVGAATLSPVTDLAQAGESWETRAAADPFFTRPQTAAMIRAYLGDRAPTDPRASPLYGDVAGLPPVRVHVGDDEVLLDDAVRYVQRAADAGGDARLDVWEGMAHGFASGVGRFDAAAQALDVVGRFLRERLAPAAAGTAR
ncbi:esterase [Gemmatimonadetes bacterium T265]|nr:esterase [Gemmatimonadetes bacterium T265]